MNNQFVTMFVWNHFTNDARVMRSCNTLAESGYHVQLISIQDNKKKLPKSEEMSKSFFVYRTSSSIPKVGFIKYLVFIIPILFLYYHYYVALLVCLCMIIPLYKKRKFIRIGWVFMGMIKQGISRPCTIIHSNDLNTLLQGIILKKIKRVPLVYDSHEVHSSRTGYDSKMYEKIERYLIKFADTVIHENETRAAYIRELYQINPEVMHNYPTKKMKEEIHDDLREKLNIRSEEPILLYQGGIQEGRGLDVLIQAMPKISKGVLILIGDGKIKSDLKQLVATLALEHRVHFIDKVPLNSLHQYTQQAFVGFQVLNNVCFNHYSASSNKLFEYIMAEIPVVACDFPEMRKVISEWKVGVLVNSHSSQSIAKAVNNLINNQEDYCQMKENCKRAKQHFNWENEKHILLNIYKNLLR